MKVKQRSFFFWNHIWGYPPIKQPQVYASLQNHSSSYVNFQRITDLADRHCRFGCLAYFWLVDSFHLAKLSRHIHVPPVRFPEASNC